MVTVEDYRDEVLLDKEAHVHIFYKIHYSLEPLFSFSVNESQTSAHKVIIQLKLRISTDDLLTHLLPGCVNPQ